MTWLHDRLDLSPFLHLTSATRRCGKSALLEVIGTLVRRPLMTSHATVAAIFRLIERDGPTLLLDEIDRRLRGADAAVLIGIINSSQRRESAYIYRCTGGDHELTAFETWCPKAFAGISHLPDTVMDRSIVLRLERQAPGTAPRWRDRDRDLVTALQRRILRWVTDSVDAILAARSGVTFPDALHDRARDAWETLLAVGDVAGGEWAGSGRAWAACVYVDADAENEGGPEEQLLADVRAVFHNEGDPPALATRSILHALHEMDSRPWSRYEKGKPLSPQGLARLLKPFHVTPNTVRLSDGGILKGYKREVLDPLWKAYCPGADSHQMSVTPVTPLKTRESSEPRPVTPGGSVTHGRGRTPPETGDVTGATGSGLARRTSGHESATEPGHVTGVTGSGAVGDGAIDDAEAEPPSPRSPAAPIGATVSEPASQGRAGNGNATARRRPW